MRGTRESGCDNENVSPTPAPRNSAEAIAAEITAGLAGAAFALPGTLADRKTRCGHPGCRCHADPPRLHGPYHQWTRKKDGKTSTRILTDELNPPGESGDSICWGSLRHGTSSEELPA